MTRATPSLDSRDSPETPDSPASDGLRPAGRATRAAIADAARELFSNKAYDDVSVRAIAAAAHVDPALVIRHFGSKEALFLAVVDTSMGVGTVIDGPVETLGRRLVAYFLKERSAAPGQFLALSQAAHRPGVREEMVRHTAEIFVRPLAPRLTGDHRELRVALMVAQFGGLLNLLYVQQDPFLATASNEDLIRLYGDAIQGLLTPS